MYQASLHPHQLIFKEPGGTSRGVLLSKMSYFIHVWDERNPLVKGIGECSVLPGLSPDDRPELKEMLKQTCKNINQLANDYHTILKEWPAIRFALEMAFLDLQNGGMQLYYPSDFTAGKKKIPINGLIWMGKIEEMNRRIEEKLAAGFRCLKMKIGALDFENEYELLKSLRTQFNSDTLEIRVDANGAFTPSQAPHVLEKLGRLSIHSIEQPIQSGQWEVMAKLCESSPIPVALDEELIGLYNETDRKSMLDVIQPQYIIIKPSLTGGFKSSNNWINLAETTNTGWWVTSALESNVGLNAIAQWTATLNNHLPQGLGTGQVFINNINSPLRVENGALAYFKQV